MNKQKTKIEIDSDSKYEVEKTFKKVVELDERQFLALCTAILNFLETEKVDDWIEKITPPLKQ